jgi:hypothetical protein
MLNGERNMRTMHGRRSGRDLPESREILKSGFRRDSLIIRNKIRPGVPYFWIVEPQKESGYPHIHAGYFTQFTDEEKDRLTSMRMYWVDELFETSPVQVWGCPNCGYMDGRVGGRRGRGNPLTDDIM